MKSQKMLKIDLKPQNLQNILEKIEKNRGKNTHFIHIVSVNPENIVIAQDDDVFRKMLSEGDIQIVDGIGVVLGGSILGIETGERVTGADLMEIILENAHTKGLRVLLLGGRANLAKELADCYQNKYSQHSFKGMEGISDIRNPKGGEESRIFSIVADYKPHIIFAAFGSPWQEKWFYHHKNALKGITCMGVGGGFDFASGKVRRAPLWMRKSGAEWLFRLSTQPWRWKRQLRLVRFMYLILLQRFGLYS